MNSTQSNKIFYNQKYSEEVAYKYKTNTRYQRYLIQRLERYIRNDIPIESLCDIGCGQGLNTALFTEDFPNVKILGIDLSESGIEIAKAKYRRITNLEFECIDVNELKSVGKRFSIVTAFELLEHIDDWKHVARLMAELSSSYIMISSPVGRMREYEKSHGHVRNFKKGELESFFEELGFSKVKTYYAGFPFWSPITRDLLNFLPGDSTELQKNLTWIGRFSSVMLYYLYRYCSALHHGDQFIGLFIKNEV